MNKKIFSYFVAFLVTAFLVACSGSKDTTATKKENTGEKPALVKLTLPLLQSINPSDVANVRFRFEKELTLTLVEEPGNGVYKVNGDGNLVLLNDKTVRFPATKLGKFSNAESALHKDASFQITWEEESYDPELGLSSLTAEYDDSLRVVIVPDGLVKGKPFVTYQKAKYSLPQDYKQYFLVVGEIKKGSGKVVSGVKTPGQEAGGN
jgi:hypothetical protein